ncbi:stage II sporulation protein D [Paenibacillus sp. JX-17]|uniref:Stage II sporulation protein D n=1 Tax=Paenibacillus lacisoli TaxID=3064525 RepID=A0ABT9CB90_9BACL|nr:stage II sporulation protein D [Paenibacillus sp. JX-17]MDO7906530.1 stage II sporulation protein D [Paenibacillus sp. JX-17]
MKDPRTSITIPLYPPGPAAQANHPRPAAPVPAAPEPGPRPAPRPPAGEAPPPPGPQRPSAAGAQVRPRTGWGRTRFGRRLRWQPVAAWAGCALLALAIPALLAWPGQQVLPVPVPVKPQTTKAVPALPAASTAAEPQVRVYVSAARTVETLPLEQYIVGVVAAEMPAEFEPEALKAQAVAARTFIMRRLAAHDTSGVPDGQAADVTDTVQHQAYLSRDRLERDWLQAGKSAQLDKIRTAVQATANIIMTYQGKPITASFFSTSNGYTENSEDVWKGNVPYLRSVASPWDAKIAPGYKEQVTFHTDEMREKLGLPPASRAASTGSGSEEEMKVLSMTQGHRIKEIEVDGKTFTGPEIRQKLGLRSSNFIWSVQGQEITITTFGYGHGVGMSQWGANGMAQEGYTATQILQHYYTGISFSKATDLL